MFLAMQHQDTELKALTCVQVITELTVSLVLRMAALSRLKSVLLRAVCDTTRCRHPHTLNPDRDVMTCRIYDHTIMCNCSSLCAIQRSETFLQQPYDPEQQHFLSHVSNMARRFNAESAAQWTVTVPNDGRILSCFVVRLLKSWANYQLLTKTNHSGWVRKIFSRHDNFTAALQASSMHMCTRTCFAPKAV